MRTLLVIGGGGNMTGMMADRHPDDMKGLLQGLRDCARYRQIILYPSERFLLPPDDPEELLPLAEFDEHLLTAARKDPQALRSKILRESTKQALGLLYEALLSSALSRQVVLICGRGNELSRSLLPVFSPAEEEDLQTQRIESDSLPLLSGIKEWPVVFERFKTPFRPCGLLPGSEVDFSFPWGIQIQMRDLLRRSHLLLHGVLPLSYPAEDALGHPRAFLMEGQRGGFLLAIPRPSNMKNFAITLQTGKGIKKEETVTAAQRAGKAPKVERNWMTRAEAAAALGKSKDSVDNYCRDGKLEAFKEGREVRITKESVQHYLDRPR